MMARGALVEPALGHRGQLGVPDQVAHPLGGRQVVAGVVAVPDRPSDGVVGARISVRSAADTPRCRPSVGQTAAGPAVGYRHMVCMPPGQEGIEQ